MSYEAISAFSALGTLLVIGGTAIAALIQLRHLRQSNQLWDCSPSCNFFKIRSLPARRVI